MNKLFTKIATLVLGMTMAVGVGVAVGSGTKASEVNATDTTDKITAADLVATSTTYTDFSNVSKTSGAVYAGNSAKSSAGAIQLRSKNSNSGIVSTTSGGKVKSVKIDVASGSNTIDVYGKNTAYTAASDLYGSSKQGTKVGSLTATGTVTFTNDYEYVGIRSNNGAIYLSSIEITWSSGGTPTTYTVSYDANAGSDTVTGMPENATDVEAGSYTLSDAQPTRAGYDFLGWGLTADATSTVTSITVDGDETVYAIWEVSTTPTISLDSNSFVGYTGKSFSVTATYSNLTSAFAWSTSGSGTTTETITSTGTETNGTSTYSGTLTGEGTKVLTATGGGVAEQARPTFTITITQTLRPVKAPAPGEKVTSTLTFKAACGGSGTADDNKAWSITSDGTESAYDPTKGIHYGTGSAAVKYIKLTSTDFTSGKITKVVVNASTASGGVSATVSVKVGDSAFGGAAQSITTSAVEYTFNGDVDASKIEVLITKQSSAVKAIYCKSIAVTYETEGKLVNIANIAGHEAAQYAVVRFAKRFNAIMDGTNNCTTGLSDAWSAIELVYDNPSAKTEAEKGFLQDIASLSSTEQDYAKDLIKYATAQWTKDTDENYEYCLERAMATYEYCVKKHEGCTAFMDSVRPVERTHVNPISIFGSTENTNAIAIVVIVSVVSLTAIGGYFFLRKKREQN